MSDVLQMLTAYLAQPIDATTTTITVKNFKDSRGNAITAMIGNILYATIEPSSQNNQEIISFTGISNLGNNLIQLTGVTRNLGPVPPHTALTPVVPHGNGAALIITDNPQMWNERTAKDKSEVITSPWEFTGRPFATTDTDAVNDRQFVTKGELTRTAFGTPTISALIVQGTAGQDLTIRQVAWLDDTTATWKLANADTLAEVNGTKKLGIVLSTTTTGNPITNGVQQSGYVSGYSGLSVGLVYVNDAGNISNTAGTNVRAVGVAISATEIIFDQSQGTYLSKPEKDAAAGTAGVPSAANPFVTANDEARNYGSIAYAATTTGDDTYVVTLSPVPTSLVNGMIVRVKFDVGNTGAATLNVNGLGALSIVTGASTALSTGNIIAGMVGALVYNSTGTVWQLLNPQTPDNVYATVAVNTSTSTNGITDDASTTSITTFKTGRLLLTFNGSMTSNADSQNYSFLPQIKVGSTYYGGGTLDHQSGDDARIFPGSFSVLTDSLAAGTYTIRGALNFSKGVSTATVQISGTIQAITL
jgi:hypothetical protein